MTGRILAAFALALLALPALPDTAPVRMRELMVGDDGTLNSTNGIATAADLAAVAASNQIAVAAQSAASAGYSQAIELLGAVATNMAAGTPIAFYSVELSSFDAAVAFDEATAKVKIVGFEDRNLTTNFTGDAAFDLWRVRFAFTEDLQNVKPLLAYSEQIGSAPRADWDFLADSLVSAPVEETGATASADADGTTYSHVYHVDIWMPSSTNGFTYVRIPNDAAVADGATIDLPNGVRNGVTDTVEWGGRTLTFTGGLLTGVGE